MHTFNIAIEPKKQKVTPVQYENARLHLAEALYAQFGENNVRRENNRFVITLNANEFTAP